MSLLETHHTDSQQVTHLPGTHTQVVIAEGTVTLHGTQHTLTDGKHVAEASSSSKHKPSKRGSVLPLVATLAAVGFVAVRVLQRVW